MNSATRQFAYAGSIDLFFSQVQQWATTNVNDVVILHFNHDITGGDDDKVLIAKSISELATKYFTNNASVLLYRHKAGEYPTLNDMISANTRVWIWMYTDLAKHVPGDWYTEAYKGGIYADTWATVPVSTSCYGVVTNAQKYYNHNLIRF